LNKTFLFQIYSVFLHQYSTGTSLKLLEKVLSGVSFVSMYQWNLFRSTVVFVIIDQETDDDCIADKVIFTTTRPADVKVIQNVPQIPS
jgi:hypothetical protein